MLNESQTLVAVAGVCVLALVLVVLGRRRRRTGTPTVLEAVAVDDADRLVLVRTHDGTQYQGRLAEPGGAPDDGSYVTLTGPIVFRRDGGEPETMPAVWDRLALPRAALTEVWTRRAPVAAEAPGAARPDARGAEDQPEREDAVGDAPAEARPSRSRRHRRRGAHTAVPTS